MIKKVIFDMDGLLFDTERLFMKKQAEISAEYGYVFTRDMYIQMMGLNDKAAIEKAESFFKDGYPSEEIRAKVRQYMGRAAKEGEIPVKKGIRELLSYLKSEGISCAVASSTRTDKVRLYLKSAGLCGYFAGVTGGDKVKRSKPEPDIFLKAAGDTPPENILILEDSENGIKAAAAAGMRVICIPDLSEPCPEVRKLAYRSAKDASEVIKIVRDENV